MWNSHEPAAFFNKVLKAALGPGQILERFDHLGGGSISHAARLYTASGSWFVKFNRQAPAGMFETEAKGLAVLQKPACLYLPGVAGWGREDGTDYLLLEYIDQGAAGRVFWERLGTGLAALHRHTAGTYGLDHDNYIGSLPQSNSPEQNGFDFFIENRLKPQAVRAQTRLGSAALRQLEQLYKKLPSLLPDLPPSLLHGDLWSGNIMAGAGGQPYIFDPAVHYGSREAELAFTTLFGNFDPVFYSSYREAFPLPAGFEERVDIYNLYPLLVHVNLFGGGYVNSVSRILKKFS